MPKKTPNGTFKRYDITEKKIEFDFGGNKCGCIVSAIFNPTTGKICITDCHLKGLEKTFRAVDAFMPIDYVEMLGKGYQEMIRVIKNDPDYLDAQKAKKEEDNE